MTKRVVFSREQLAPEVGQKPHRVIVRYDPDLGEYTVELNALFNGQWVPHLPSMYYTEDLEDARGTALAMFNH